MDLAIIIVSYNVRELLRECLQSTFASLALSPGLAAEVWVVDNASQDDSAAMVAANYPQARLVASRENLGFAAGNNRVLRLLGFQPPGAEATIEGPAQRPDAPLHPTTLPRHVLLLNPDTVVHGDAVAQMVAFLDGHPGFGGCGGRLVYPDGSFQHSAFCFPGLAQIYFDFYPPPGRLSFLLDSRWNGRYSHRLYATGKPFPVDFVLGAALMVRAKAIEKVGLLDEGYYMYCEEMDWQRRMQEAGWRMACVPAAVITHHGGASSSQFHGAMVEALWRSRLRYFHRYHGTIFNRLAHTLMRSGAQAEARRLQHLNPPDLPDRLATYDTVKRLAGG
jgi:N-acetylglucosaminyl-diphospho-decaprenol L-rhamnosyltransferase